MISVTLSSGSSSPCNVVWLTLKKKSLKSFELSTKRRSGTFQNSEINI